MGDAGPGAAAAMNTELLLCRLHEWSGRKNSYGIEQENVSQACEDKKIYRIRDYKV